MGGSSSSSEDLNVEESGSSGFFNGFSAVLRHIGLAIAEGFQQMIMSCTDTSHPHAVGFAYKSMFEMPADPLFDKYLSVNASQHLEYHYSSVRDSLNPVQLAGFNQSLSDTIGGNGTVVFGSAGVMALALAMLFDVLAAQMKGQKPLPDPIQQIFHGEGEALSNMRTAISDCLDRLPRGASDKEKMLLEIERCEKHVEDTLSNYTVYVLNQAKTTGHYIKTTERNHVLNAYLFNAYLIIHFFRLRSEDSFKSLEVTEEKTEKLRLLYVFAPNVTYALQNWDQKKNKNSHCKPHTVMLWLSEMLNKPSERPTLNEAFPNSTFTYQLSSLGSVLKSILKIEEKQEDFVI